MSLASHHCIGVASSQLRNCYNQRMSVSSGKKAEKIAANYLQSRGYKVIDMNWRRPRCEIDIVASKTSRVGLFRREKTIHLVEVKYRKNAEQGSGLDYITDQKLSQMKFAAKMWVNENDWPGAYELSAIEVADDDFEVTEFLERLDN